MIATLKQARYVDNGWIKTWKSYSYPAFSSCFALLQSLMSLYFGETDQTKGMHNP